RIGRRFPSAYPVPATVHSGARSSACCILLASCNDETALEGCGVYAEDGDLRAVMVEVDATRRLHEVGHGLGGAGKAKASEQQVVHLAAYVEVHDPAEAFSGLEDEDVLAGLA